VSLPLDHREALHLARLFLKTEAMGSRHSRDLFLGILNRELGYVLAVLRYDKDLYDMLEIVTTCLSRPGVLHTLVECIEHVHPGSRSVQAVRDLVEELLPEPLLRSDERRDLHQLATALERNALGQEGPTLLRLLYREVAGPTGPPLEHMVLSSRDVLSQLEDLQWPDDGVPPLLRFVELLAGRVRDPHSAELHSWLCRFAERRGLPPPSRPVPALSEQVGRHPPTHAYLVIECRPDSASPDHYLTSAWLQYPGEPGISLLREDLPKPFGELPSLLERLLTRDHHVVNRHASELTVEFVLPRQLVGAPFDQYRYTSRGLPRRVGLDHPVVVRSLDRMRNQHLRRSWQRKWDWFTRNPQDGVVTWVAVSGEYGAERLYAMLAEKSKVCLVMAFAPEDGPDLVDELEIGLQAGTPILLWRREAADPQQFITEVSKLLSADLMSLPQRVQELRIEAAQAVDDRHPGNHLTLLFEDADRVPEPYVRLRTPN